jgi:hypothetical protein
MKNKSKELDVDFIGGQVPMTKEEELVVGKFIKAQKDLQNKKQHRLSGRHRIARKFRHSL